MCLGLLALPVPAGAARADCQEEVTALAQRVEQVKQGEQRTRLDALLEQARRELLENDETECRWAAHEVAEALEPHS